MSAYFTYFAAPTHEALSWAGPGPSATRVPQTGEMKQVDPYVLLGELVAHAAGRRFSIEEIEPLIAMKIDDAEEPIPRDRMLVRVDDDWVAQLASIADEQLEPLATAWSTSEYWIGARSDDADVAELTEIVRELRSVARAVSPSVGEGMFAWAIV